MFSTYVPSDYNGLIGEYLDACEKKCEQSNGAAKGMKGANGHV